LFLALDRGFVAVEGEERGWPSPSSTTANRRTGALDLPGRTWHDRPAVERGDGVFLAGDMVAAPGLLSEVSFHSAITAARGALGCPR
jgi:hypothetical protein